MTFTTCGWSEHFLFWIKQRRIIEKGYSFAKLLRTEPSISLRRYAIRDLCRSTGKCFRCFVRVFEWSMNEAVGQCDHRFQMKASQN